MLGGEVGEGTDWRAQHHAVRAHHRLGGIKFGPVGDAKLHHSVERLAGPGVDDHFRRDIAAQPSDAGNRGSDQPNAQQCEPLENRFSHELAA